MYTSSQLETDADTNSHSAMEIKVKGSRYLLKPLLRTAEAIAKTCVWALWTYSGSVRIPTKITNTNFSGVRVVRKSFYSINDRAGCRRTSSLLRRSGKFCARLMGDSSTPLVRAHG